MIEKWLNETRSDEQGNIIEVLPDENGNYTLQYETEDGQRASTFKGKSMLEVAKALSKSQIEATKSLGKLLRPDKGREVPLRVEPKSLSPAEKLRLSSDILDPDKIEDAVMEIVTAKTGVAPSAMAERVGNLDQRDADAYYRAEAQAFLEEHPEYYPVQQNQVMLFNALEARGYDLTRNNLGIVFNQLLNEGKMVHWPSDDATAESGGGATPDDSRASARGLEPAANGAPRSISSGLRSSDANGMKPQPPKPKPLVTRAEVDRMSRAEYNERLRDPAFRKAVDALV